MVNMLSFPKHSSAHRLYTVRSAVPHIVGGTLRSKGFSPMKHIVAIVFILAVAVGVGSYHETSTSLDWIPLLTGSILIAAAVLTGLSLRFSGFGRSFLGRLWPGQFSEGRHKRTATARVIVLLFAYLLWGIGTLLQSGGSSQLESIERALTVLGTLGVCGALWVPQLVLIKGAEH
jgi:hypothetical protein